VKKIIKNWLVFILLGLGFLVAQQVLAQNFGLNAVGNGLGGSLSSSEPRILAGRIINIGLGFLGVIALGFIAYAGFLWLVSGGDEEKIRTARSILKNGVIGLVIILSSWAIATFIISRLMGATTGGNTCYEGETRSCGCGGSMICGGGSFGSCIGSDCGGIIAPPASCDSSPNPGCQALNQICAAQDYCDGGDCSCKPKGNLGDSCNASSNPTCSPDNNRCAQYLTCNPSTCTCYGPPVITEVSPVGGFCEEDKNKACSRDEDCSTNCNLTDPNGTANNFITIFGKNFGEYSAATSAVAFFGNGSNAKVGLDPQVLNPNCIQTWRDDEIIIAVPDGAPAGPLWVVTKDSATEATNDDYGPKIPDFIANNIKRPGLCNLSPLRGVLSSAVNYQGINLYSGTAYFGNYQNNISGLNSQFTNSNGLSGTSTIPNIKPGDSSSFVKNNINLKSNYLRFVKNPEKETGPFISSFSPLSGNVGQYVTIKGSGFGNLRGLSQVYFYSGATSTEASYDFPEVCANSVWNNNQIIVKVPALISTDEYGIKIKFGTTTIDITSLTPNFFKFNKNLDLKPSLCKIEPTRGPIGSPVLLWGEYFGPLKSEALVKFNYERSATGTIEQTGRANSIKTTVATSSITGPVKVIKKNEAGNELNFSVGECIANSDCGLQICCPANTYKKGRCVNSLDQCFIDIPTSVFEWSFDTGFGTSTPNPYDYSCAGLAQYYGSCQTGSSCPNTPGTCSPYAGGGGQIIGPCDYTCNSLPGCSSNRCVYNNSLDQCLERTGSCSLPTVVNYTVTASSPVAASSTAICNQEKHWQITLKSSCPDNWLRTPNDQCVDPNSNCSLCVDGLSCTSFSGVGRCFSPKLCQSGASCKSNYDNKGDSCVKIDQPTCDCCCTIGRDAQDCCSYKTKSGTIGQLSCEGTCGSDKSITDGPNGTNSGLGKCGGCAAAGDTPEERDAACNCSSHSGQFCNITPDFPRGVCSDCSSLNGQDCTSHSSACCLDSRKTATSADDICVGGNGQQITASSTLPGYGYCAYYNCQSPASTPPGDPAKCASSTPVKIGDYTNVQSCTDNCAKSDPCSGITDFVECTKNSRCCFDGKVASMKDLAPLSTGYSSKFFSKLVTESLAAPNTACRLGAQITDSSHIDAGYCAYYNCKNTGGSTTCDSANPVKDGKYQNTNSCSSACTNPPSGAGVYCGGLATSTCASSQCNFPGFACLLSNGLFGSTPPDCGTCCCQPGTANDACTVLNSKLKCEPNRGSCAGANRGLCCGCSSDNDCDSTSLVGCGSDTCCQARPNIVSPTSPYHLAQQVCRNAAIKVNFDQPMSITSFSNNVLLLAEKDYSNGPCPEGTFAAADDLISGRLAAASKNSLFSWSSVKSVFKKIVNYFGTTALADVPDSNKLYCAVPGTVSGEDSNNQTSLIFTPQSLLDPATNYYFIVLGDASLNSQTGVLSSAKIGFNGLGYFNAETSLYVAGESIMFNNRSYKNSQIIKFSTMSAASNSGLCAIDKVQLSPESYLFKTADNDLNEDDNNSAAATFDSVADRDKVFAAAAYSQDDQLLRPVTGYFWDWNFTVNNPNLATLAPATGLEPNKILVSVKTGISDAETKVKAEVKMDRFSLGCNSGACSCQGDNCPQKCCNSYFQGRNSSVSSDIYIFLCNNPWPPIKSSGSWSPWVDTCQGSLDPNCGNYNYKFYYCRDAGAAGTLDDLPAIIDQAVIRGNSSNLVCSVDRQPCSNINTLCGADTNGDGNLDGLCIWNVLKESYFFREAILPGSDLVGVSDTGVGQTVQINWRSKAADVSAYKIYYLPAGDSNMLFLEFASSAVCTLSGGVNNCQASINQLTNNIPYIFKVSVISSNRTESSLSNEKTVTPTDQTAPAAPSRPQAQVSGNSILFTWPATNDAVAYKLLRGINSGKYAESFTAKDLLKTFSADKFAVGKHYFALTALDASNNESQKSAELKCQVSLKEGCSSLATPGCLLLNCCADDISCGQALGAPNGFNGSASCNSNFSGYNTAYCQRDLNYWLEIPRDTITDSLTSSGTPCWVKLNVDSNNVLECSDSWLRSGAQWFKGKILVDSRMSCNPPTNNIFCAVDYRDASGVVKTCQKTENNRCRYSYSCSQPFNWTNRCYIFRNLEGLY